MSFVSHYRSQRREDMNTRGKRLAGWTAASGLAVLAVTAFLGRHTAREFWYLYRLESPSETDRDSVAAALLEMKSARAAPRILRTFAESSDLPEWIARVVEELGPKAGTALPVLVDALERGDSDVRVAAARALRHLGRDARDAVPALIRALTNKDLEIRSCAAETLERIGEPAAPAVPALVRALEESSWQVRDIAARALVAIGSAAVSPLIDALSREGREQSLLAVWTLGEIGPKARAATDLLEGLLRTSHSGLRRQAALALGKIRPETPTTVSALENALTDPDHHVRTAAVEALRKVQLQRGEKE